MSEKKIKIKGIFPFNYLGKRENMLLVKFLLMEGVYNEYLSLQERFWNNQKRVYLKPLWQFFHVREADKKTDWEEISIKWRTYLKKN